MVIAKNFKLIAPVQTKSTEYDRVLYIDGIANSGNEDLVGDIVTTDALNSIVQQAPNKNLHYNHENGKDSIIGTIVESELRDGGAWIKASILNESRGWIESYLDQGIKFGLSISGTCSYEDGSYSNITEWQLTEISLTDTPCDPATMGTVSMSKSFDDLIMKIKNKQYKPIKEEKPMADDVEYITVEDATKLVNDAFNERKEEFLETIRDEIKSEYETALNELKERMDTLESKLEEPAPAPADEPAPAEDKAEDEEDKPSEDKEDEEKSLTEKQIKAIVENKIKSIFDDASKSADFKYNEHKKAPETENKKSYTAKELAEMGVI